MITFPIHVPKIEVEFLPNETLALERRDIWGLLLEVGAECVTGYYYRYEGDKSPPLYFSRRQVVARLKFKGRDCLEIQNKTWNPGDTEPPDLWDTTSYQITDKEGTACVRSIYRNKKDGSASLWEVTEPMEPWQLMVGTEDSGISVHEGEERRTFERSWKITGVASVRIGNRTFRCLRQLIHHHYAQTWVCETFISDNGRTVLTRGYESERGDQFEYVKGQPELKIDGVTHRLLCDMIHDHALSDGTTMERYEPPVPHMTRFGRM